jgi:hypothetical protein
VSVCDFRSGLLARAYTSNVNGDGPPSCRDLRVRLVARRALNISLCDTVAVLLRHAHGIGQHEILHHAARRRRGDITMDEFFAAIAHLVGWPPSVAQASCSVWPLLPSCPQPPRLYGLSPAWAEWDAVITLMLFHAVLYHDAWLPNVEQALVAPVSSGRSSSDGRELWTVDCGASRHCVPSRQLLSRVTSEVSPVRVRVADGKLVPVECVGDVVRSVRTADGCATVTLTGVLVVPGFVCNVYSCEFGYRRDCIRTELNGSRRLILADGAVVPFLPAHGSYVVDLSSQPRAAVVSPPRGGGAHQAHTASTTTKENQEKRP